MLDDRIKARILDDHKKLTADGKLLSRSQLEACYRTFRSRFGPDVLAKLDGEELLETMHAHGNKDSLVYWLEFKNDDEFPARFGSISGGSAFKFGIFRRKETGTWVTGSPQGTVEAADRPGGGRDRPQAPGPIAPRGGAARQAARAGRRRRVPAGCKRTSTGSPRRSATWPGATSTSACSPPRRLDDYHNADYQRFHLVKMLQVPPEGDGRYLCAGRYVAAAHELGIPINHLTTTLNHHDGEPHAYWRIGTSDGQQPRNRWPLMRDGACVAIGWPDLGDLSGYEKDTPSKEKLIQAARGAVSRKPPADRQGGEPDPQLRQGDRQGRYRPGLRRRRRSSASVGSPGTTSTNRAPTSRTADPSNGSRSTSGRCPSPRGSRPPSTG